MRSNGFIDVWSTFTIYSFEWFPMRTNEESIDYKWMSMKSPGPRENTEETELIAFKELPIAAVAFAVVAALYTIAYDYSVTVP